MNFWQDSLPCFKVIYINVNENRRGNQEWTIHRNWQQWAHMTQDTGQRQTQQKHNNIYVGHHYT